MISNTYKLTRFIINHYKLATNLGTHFLKSAKAYLPSTRRALLIAAGTALSLGCAFAIEDEAIRNLKGLMNKEISALRNEYGQTTVYPEIKYELRGNAYEIIF
jgi:hypothetical protein